MKPVAGADRPIEGHAPGEGPDVVAGAADGTDELQAFAYAVSHDLAEPMRAITGFVRLLEDSARDKLDDDELEYLAFITEGADRMRSLLDGVLAYSRVVTGGAAFAPIDLGDTVAAVLGELASELEAVDARVGVEPLPTVEGDERQIRTALHELVANALRFRHPARPPVIQIDARRGVAGWTISVADNGIGIADRDRANVFAMFSRLQRRDEYDGLGVGLALVARVAQRHGGRVWVADGIDGGAAICLCLPDGVSSS